MTSFGRHRENLNVEEWLDMWSSITNVNTYYNTSETTIGGPYAYRASKKSDIMDDVVLSDYEKQLASGLALPCNPMTHEKVESSIVPGYYHLHYRKSSWAYSDQTGDILTCLNSTPPRLEPYDSSVSGSVLGDATLRAYAAVDSAEIKVLASLAELADTREMIGNLFRSIHKISKKMRSLTKTINEIEIVPRKTSRLVTTAENTWMGIRMGWLPFIGEVQSLYNAITASVRPNWQTFRGNSAVSRSAAASKDYYWNQMTTNIDSVTTEMVTARTTILCEQRVHRMPDTFGLTQIPETLWEITPLSWAFDYIFNFGDILAAHTPDLLWRPIRVSGVTRTTRIEQHRQSGGTTYSNTNFYSGSGITGGSKTYRKQTTVRRNEPPMGGIVTSLNLNWEKLIDLSIVGRQFAGKAFSGLLTARKRTKNKKIRRMLKC